VSPFDLDVIGLSVHLEVDVAVVADGLVVL